MKVLMSNDDGVHAPGLWTLARLLAKKAEVLIVAPEGQRSAISHAVTLHKPLRINHHQELEAENIRVYSTNGTPADCVMLGLLEVEPETDVVVSGINGGPNLGEDVMYSGTVAAAIEGALLGVRSMSVSLSEYAPPSEYALAAHFAAGIAVQLNDPKLPARTIININAPPVTLDKYKGFRITKLGSRKYSDILQKRIDPRGGTYFWVTGRLVRDVSDPDSDNTATADGFVSITPILLDLTDLKMFEKLEFADPLE
jgi:5'-nucleotidase